MSELLELACCELLLELYRGARELSVADFPDYAFGLVSGVLRFDAARYTALKFLDPGAVVCTSHVWNEATDTVLDWEQINRHDTVVPTVLAAPGRAFNFHQRTLFAGPGNAIMRDFVERTAHRNNLVIAPLNTVMRRFEDNNSYLKDEIDGIYLKVNQGTDSVETASVVTAILTTTHKDAGDFNVVVPAGLLEQKRRTQFTFKVVMICIAGISLLVGGIGIMNIMLATVLERTREIGIRRAIGARQMDIIRQFLTEAVLISIMGGLIGILFGFTLSQIIAKAAGWSTVVTATSIGVAFGVSVGIGLLFGIYPAMQAAKLDPIEAIRYE